MHEYDRTRLRFGVHFRILSGQATSVERNEVELGPRGLSRRCASEKPELAPLAHWHKTPMFHHGRNLTAEQICSNRGMFQVGRE